MENFEKNVADELIEEMLSKAESDFKSALKVKMIAVLKAQEEVQKALHNLGLAKKEFKEMTYTAPDLSTLFQSE